MSVRIMTLALWLVAGSAYACPNLTGQFACATDDTTEVLTVYQSNQDKHATIDINGSDLIIDDQDHSLITNDPEFRNALFHTSCTDTTIARRLKADFYDGQQKVGSIDSTVEYSLQNDAFVETTHGKMTSAQGDTPLDDQIICKRAGT